MDSFKWSSQNYVFMMNPLKPEQNGLQFADDIFKKCVFSNENYYIVMPLSLKFVPESLVEKSNKGVSIGFDWQVHLHEPTLNKW